MTEQEKDAVLRNDPDSLAPVALDRLTVEEETALMSRGKGARLIGASVLLVMCGAGLVFWLKGLDARQKYSDALDQVAAVQEQQADTFLHCALPGIHRSKIGSSEHLQSVIERFDQRLGRSYGRTLARCASTLTALEPALRALSVPEAVRGDLVALRAAAKKLESAWTDYRGYLTESGQAHEQAKSTARIEQIAQAWAGYEQRRTQLESALRTPH